MQIGKEVKPYECKMIQIMEIARFQNSVDALKNSLRMIGGGALPKGRFPLEQFSLAKT